MLCEKTDPNGLVELLRLDRVGGRLPTLHWKGREVLVDIPGALRNECLAINPQPEYKPTLKNSPRVEL